ncbi:MAG TPA: enoyl-CoA hydratase/isomerase family protein [Thermoanaerobaculia bacterium]|jgi:enoyl-CoA hydratase
MFERHLSDDILTLRLAHGKASALDLELSESLRIELETVAKNPRARAVILTGTGSIFSAGVDLPRLVDAGGDYVERFVGALDALLRAMFLFPRPMVAAINGHAIAGGALMAFACDYRLMSSGRIGVPEALVGVPFPPLALEIVRYTIPVQHLQSMIYLAKTIEAKPARTMGIVDEVVSSDQLLSRARAIAAQLADIPPAAFALTKRQLREPYLREARSDEIVALWSSPVIHDRIRAYLAKTIGKR